MTADNYHIFVHYDRGSPTKFFDGIGDSLYCPVIESGVLVIRNDVRNFHITDLH